MLPSLPADAPLRGGAAAPPRPEGGMGTAARAVYLLYTKISVRFSEYLNTNWCCQTPPTCTLVGVKSVWSLQNRCHKSVWSNSRLCLTGSKIGATKFKKSNPNFELQADFDTDLRVWDQILDPSEPISVPKCENSGLQSLQIRAKPFISKG